MLLATTVVLLSAAAPEAVDNLQGVSLFWLTTPSGETIIRQPVNAAGQVMEDGKFLLFLRVTKAEIILLPLRPHPITKTGFKAICAVHNQI